MNKNKNGNGINVSKIQDIYRHDILLLEICRELENDGWITAAIFGSKPIDFVAIKNHTIIFGEVKSGSVNLSKREKKIKDIVRKDKPKLKYQIFTPTSLVKLRKKNGVS